jgi:hypothetical protein
MSISSPVCWSRLNAGRAGSYLPDGLLFLQIRRGRVNEFFDRLNPKSLKHHLARQFNIIINTSFSLSTNIKDHLPYQCIHHTTPPPSQ